MLRALFGCWILVAAAAIEFYARRYEYAGAALIPHGALAALAVAQLFLPVPRRQAARVAAVGVGCGAALLLALHHPFQLLHVLAVVLVLAVALAGLALLPRQRLTLALALATLNFLLFAYYAVLFIGRESWNQVVSRELLWTYLWQLPELVAALPLHPALPWGGAAALFLGLLLAYWAAAPGIARGVRETGAGLRRYASGRARLAVLAIVAASGALSAEWVFRNAAYGANPDPLVTTFFVQQDQAGRLSLPFAPSPALLGLDREVAARYAAPAAFDAKTLVLITVDALRADQMHVYGHTRQNTPFLSRLYREGRLTRFDNTFAVCTYSLCGLLAVQASRHWHELGTRNFALPDALKRLGYRNHFLLGGDHANFYGLRSFYGLNIDEYFDGSMASGYMNDDAAVLERLAQLDASGAAPRFVYLHLMSVHLIGKRHPQYRVWYGTEAGLRDVPACCASSRDYANKYHDGILQADALIERIFGILEGKGLLRNAIIAITADHGEMLGEASQIGHGGGPLDPVVRVPLLLYDSDGYAYPAHLLSSIVDIAPTLLDRIGAPIPPHWAGVPLSRTAPRRFAFMQGHDVHAAIGAFDGVYYKLYRDFAGERLVRIAAGAAEYPAAHADAHAALGDALERHLPQHLPRPRRERTAVR